jgi:chemotaxis-related protein WspB
MLYLLFRVAGQRYVLDAAQVTEVLPLVAMTPVVQPPQGLAGVMDFRGVPLPVLDLSRLLANQSAEPRLSTRVVVVEFVDASGRRRQLGVIAEHATSIVRREATDFVPSGSDGAGPPFLAAVAADGEGLLHLIDVTRLPLASPLGQPRDAGALHVTA